MLFAILVLTLIFGTIWPFFDAATMLLVFDPFANISSAISMFVSSVAMCLIIAPRALIDIAIGMDENTMPISLIILPLAIIFTAILPDLLPIAVFHTVQELAGVDCTITQSNWTIILSLIIVHHFACDSRYTADWSATAILVHDGAWTGSRIVVEDGEDAGGYALAGDVRVAYLPLMRCCTLHSRSIIVLHSSSFGGDSSCILLMRPSPTIIILILHIIHTKLILRIFLHSHTHCFS